MRALCHENGSLQLHKDYPMPQCAEGEALVKIRLAGICGTDLAIMRGYADFQGVLGHEFVGEVVSCDEPFWVGRRVVGEINTGCGHCDTCLRGDGNHCPRRSVLGIRERDGVFAEYCAIPTRNLHAVPDAVSDEAAVFTEPLAAAVEVLERQRPVPDSRVVVVGDGRLGQLVARVLALSGAEIIVVSRHRTKASRLERLAIETVTPDQAPQRFSMGHKADLVVDCSGSHEGLMLAMELVRARGTLVLKSTLPIPHRFDFAPLVIQEIALVGSRCGPFAPALRIMERGLLDPTDLIEKVYSLGEGISALEHAGKQGVLKVLLRS